MKPNDPFEQRLSNEPLRQIPAAWREEILGAAEAHRPAGPLPERGFAPVRWSLRELLWPCPRAWAGLAAAWVAILAVNFATSEATPESEIRHAALPAPEKWQMLRLQQEMLAELAAATEEPDPGKAIPAIPQPRSQRQEEFGVA
jgi:hypothetical protein